MENHSAWQWTNRLNLFQFKNDGRYFYFATKRLFDVVIALLLLILLLPVMLLITILIKLDSSGPILFVQKRVGARRQMKNGQIFWQIKNFSFYKFRTMKNNTGDDLHQQFMQAYIAGDEARMAELQPDPEASTAFKLTNDPRVTRIGEFLRQTSLDELPQLWNVIKGDMSLVGPRPPIPYEVAMYSPEHLKRLAASPGITGLWQVSGRCETSFDELVALDIEYIQKQSLWLDFKILLMTATAIISEKGAG